MKTYTIKPPRLEWWDLGCGIINAGTPFGEVYIEERHGQCFELQLHKTSSAHPTLESAKAAAERWYIARVEKLLDVAGEQNGN